MLDREKPLEWIGSSHKDLMALPVGVRRFFGYALSLSLAKELGNEKATRRRN